MERLYTDREHELISALASNDEAVEALQEYWVELVWGEKDVTANCQTYFDCDETCPVHYCDEIPW